jgi:hypothetical protein
MNASSYHFPHMNHKVIFSVDFQTMQKSNMNFQYTNRESLKNSTKPCACYLSSQTITDTDYSKSRNVIFYIVIGNFHALPYAR